MEQIFSWSWMLALPMATSVVWGMVMALSRKKKTRAQLLLAMTLFAEGIAMLACMCYYEPHREVLCLYRMLSSTACLFAIPMYYIGICSMTEPRGCSLTQRRMLLVPLAVVLVRGVLALWIGYEAYERMCRQLLQGCEEMISGSSAWNVLLVIEKWAIPIVVVLMGAVLTLVSRRKMLLFGRRFNSWYADVLHAKKFNLRGMKLQQWLFIPAMLILGVINFRELDLKVWEIALGMVLLTAMQFRVGFTGWKMDYDARSLAQYIQRRIEGGVDF